MHSVLKVRSHLGLHNVHVRRTSLRLRRHHHQRSIGEKHQHLRPEEVGRGEDIAQRKRRQVLRPEARRRPETVVDNEQNAVNVAALGREQVGGLLGRERPLHEESRETHQLDNMVDGMSNQEGNDEQNQRDDKWATNGLGLFSRCLGVKKNANG